MEENMYTEQVEKTSPSEEGIATGRKQTTKRSPIHCIIPPHMLKELAKKGSPKQKIWH